MKNSQVLVCPSLRNMPRSGGFAWNYGGASGSNGFGYQPWMAVDTRTGACVSEGDITETADTILLGDSSPSTDNQLGYVDWYKGFLLVPSNPNFRQCLADQHNGGGNYGYVDGHAKWIAQSQSSKIWAQMEVVRP